jgi:hypothetical protein
MSKKMTETRLKVQAFIEIAMDFFTLERLRDEMSEYIGDETPVMEEFSNEIYRKLQEYKRLFKYVED